MRIFGKVIFDYGERFHFSDIFRGPYPVGCSGLSDIDVSKTHAAFSKNHNNHHLYNFLRGEGILCFYPNLHLPFIVPHSISEIVIGHHGWPYGIKEFNATFTTYDGREIIKNYQMPAMTPYHYFWIEFPVFICDVVACDIHVVSSLDGKHDNVHLNGIRFLVDSWEHDIEFEMDRLSLEPWL
eukprot:gnl/Carplike_NY0171/5288_a7213_185.p1 GENE.gnl/Carplike_NY0171/5288_a7213_185~~gnl/Carplike_NY0171/5288_a7213_185.p1  ORF type:complete len:182 (+),score=18.74 gnl/Carplike_NY0171/5288_a7213_185:97-642(+)